MYFRAVFHCVKSLMSSPRRSTSWFSLLLESFFVVLGVVLALGANEWREARNREAHADQALASIQEELQTNRGAIADALDYHLYLADTLNTLSRYNAREGTNQTPVYPRASVFNRGYIHPTTLLYTAWETAKATNAVETIDFGLLLSISRMYEDQQRYGEQGQMAGAQIYQALFTKGHQGILQNYENHLSIIASFWYRECALLHDYDAMLEQLGASVREASPIPALCTRSRARSRR